MMVGNGLDLPISIIGNFQVFIFHSAFIVPTLKKRLLSVFYLLLIIIATLCFIHEVFL
jgi:hypothetical protein